MAVIFNFGGEYSLENREFRVKNFDWNLFPYGYYKAKDGYVTIAAGSDQDFRGMLKVLGRWDLENDWRFVFDRITDDIDKLKGLEDEFKKRNYQIHAERNCAKNAFLQQEGGTR